MAQKTKTPDLPCGDCSRGGCVAGELRLSPSQRVLGSVALVLAESIEVAPVYARAPLAGKLTDIVVMLAEVELLPANLSLLEGLEQ